MLGAVDPGGALTAAGREMARMPVHPRLARLATEAAALGARDQGCAAAALLSAGARGGDLFALLETEWDRAARLAFEELRRLAPRGQAGRGGDDALLRASLAAFPDRVARRRRDKELLLAGGGSAVLAVETASEFLVAIDA
jgi:ATP-dependent helicase HrpB